MLVLTLIIKTPSKLMCILLFFTYYIVGFYWKKLLSKFKTNPTQTPMHPNIIFMIILYLDNIIIILNSL